MKIIKLIILTSVVCTLLSCQKELNFDTTGVSSGVFKKGSGGDCLPVTSNGIFKVDSVLNASHFVDVQVNVTNPGTFDIKSDTINGYFFSKTGSVVFGINTIRLYASGKPVVAGSNTFTIKYGTSICSFVITVAASTTGTAIFNLAGAPLSCTAATIAGTYIAGKPLDITNTLTIQVNVTTIGTYAIGAASSTGLVFTGTGTFNTTGLQTVTLNGSGTPLSAGITPITVTNFASLCTFAVTVLPASAGTPAVFTLSGAPGVCTPATVNGTYIASVLLNTLNTAVIQVNVTTAGSYTITTDTLNGMTFSKSGVFTGTGLQNVTLEGKGAPQAIGSFIYTPKMGSSTCTFTVPVVAPAPGTITCKIDGVFKTFNVNATGLLATPSPLLGQAMEISGDSLAGGIESIALDINTTVTGMLITPGVYGQGFPTKIAQIYYYAPPTGVFWYGISTVNPVVLTVLTITSTKVTGTFSGTIIVDGGLGTTQKLITEGTFDVPLY